MAGALCIGDTLLPRIKKTSRQGREAFQAMKTTVPCKRHAVTYAKRQAFGLPVVYAPSIRTILGVKEPSTSTSSRWLAITARMSL